MFAGDSSSRNARRHHRQPGRGRIPGANNRPGSSRRIRNAAAQNQAVRNHVSSITQKRYPLRLAAIAKLVLVCAASNGSLCRLQVRLRRAVTRTSVLDGSGWSEESCWRWRIAWHSKAKPYACIGPPRFISHRWWRSVRSGGQSALQSRDQSELSMDPRTSGGYHQAGRLRALRSLAG